MFARLTRAGTGHWRVLVAVVAGAAALSAAPAAHADLIFAVNNARKNGDNLFTGTAAGRGTGEVRSGALEGSGADPTRAMTDMIASLRAFESGQKVISTIDSTLQKASNQVGSVS